jgi:hypothetical protein
LCDRSKEDLFENPELLPIEMQSLIEHYNGEIENRDPYQVCRDFEADANRLGYTFDWGLDGQPFGLRKLDSQA